MHRGEVSVCVSADAIKILSHLTMFNLITEENLSTHQISKGIP